MSKFTTKLGALIGAATLCAVATSAEAGRIEALFGFAISSPDAPADLTVRAIFDEADAVIGAGDASLLFDDFANEGEDLVRTITFSFDADSDRMSSRQLDVDRAFRSLFIDIETVDGGSLFEDATFRVWSASFNFFETDSEACRVGLTDGGIGHGYDADSGDCLMTEYALEPVLVSLRRIDDQEPGEVPEPATLALLGFGAAGLGIARRRTPR